MEQIDKLVEAQLKNKITGVVHVGAHRCEEFSLYERLGVKRVIWFEADPSLYNDIKEKYKDKTNNLFFNYAVSNENGEKEFNIANNDGASSSLLEFKRHSYYYKDIKYVKKITVPTITLDHFFETNNIDMKEFNYLYIDTQGTEYIILEGSKKLLENISYVYLELNFEEMYSDCKLFNEIDAFLSRNYGILRKATEMTSQGWGDGFYIKL